MEQYTGHYTPPERPAKKDRHNDEERRLWVVNDEGLYDMQRGSGKSVKAWIRENRALIDECIDGVVSGEHRAHYLKYGG